MVMIVGASIVAGWPVTAERVNLAVFVFVYAASLFGALRIVSAVDTNASGSQRWPQSS